MQKWEYYMFARSIVNKKGLNSSSTNLWNKEDNGYFLDSNGRTAFDYIDELGGKGWELVNVAPISTLRSDYFSGFSEQILFTFKRPLD